MWFLIFFFLVLVFSLCFNKNNLIFIIDDLLIVLGNIFDDDVFGIVNI